MFPRYQLSVWFEDVLVYDRYFKSLNNAIKISSGFDNCTYMELYDCVLDRTIDNASLKDFIKELCSEME